MYCIILYYTILYNTILFYTILYYEAPLATRNLTTIEDAAKAERVLGVQASEYTNAKCGPQDIKHHQVHVSVKYACDVGAGVGAHARSLVHVHPSRSSNSHPHADSLWGSSVEL